MAITAATTLSDFSGFLPEAIAGPIFDDAAKQSVVMRVAPREPLGPNGVSIPIDLGRIEADWVDEGGEKHKTESDTGLRSMHPHKIAAIVVVSQEVLRANPANYVTSLYGKFAGAFARSFDMAALHGLSGTGHAAGPFDVDLSDTAHIVNIGTGTTMYNDLVSAGKELALDGNSLKQFVFSDYAYWLMADELDGSNRPLFMPDVIADEGGLTTGRLIGKPCVYADVAGFEHTLGFAGDFSKCAWGAVGGINYSVSTEASVTINGSLVSLWEKNLVAIRAEAEYGFVVSNTTASHFVKFHSSGDLGTLGTPMDMGTY